MTAKTRRSVSRPSPTRTHGLGPTPPSSGRRRGAARCTKASRATRSSRRSTRSRARSRQGSSPKPSAGAPASSACQPSHPTRCSRPGRTPGAPWSALFATRSPCPGPRADVLPSVSTWAPWAAESGRTCSFPTTTTPPSSAPRTSPGRVSRATCWSARRGRSWSRRSSPSRRPSPSRPARSPIAWARPRWARPLPAASLRRRHAAWLPRPPTTRRPARAAARCSSPLDVKRIWQPSCVPSKACARPSRASWCSKLATGLARPPS